MRVVCPVCFAIHELDAVLSDEDARNAIALLSRLPGELQRPVMLYLGCFRPPKRALSWSRFLRLLAELAEAIDAGRIRRRGRIWRVTAEQWGEALRIVVNRRDAGQIELPLKSHGYLLEVARGLSDRAEAVDEREVEEMRRNRVTVGPSDGGTIVNHARRYEQLLAEARALGVDTGPDGSVRNMSELYEAVLHARKGSA